jgi:hypothetical protein
MISIFRLLYSCCIRPDDHTATPDETSRLIPVVIDHLPNAASPDPENQQRIQERLGDIVRSTQGKMVDVAAQSPFNLHNQNTSPQSLDQISNLNVVADSAVTAEWSGDASSSRTGSTREVENGNLTNESVLQFSNGDVVVCIFRIT